jgi:hypothetical protein
LLLAVVPHVHADYSTDQMVEELARLMATDPAAAAEILERMLNAHSPNYDMDDKLKGLIQALAEAGHRAAALRCIDKLRQSLPGMLDFYKKLFASA